MGYYARACTLTADKGKTRSVSAVNILTARVSELFLEIMNCGGKTFQDQLICDGDQLGVDGWDYHYEYLLNETPGIDCTLVMDVFFRSFRCAIEFASTGSSGSDMNGIVEGLLVSLREIGAREAAPDIKDTLVDLYSKIERRVRECTGVILKFSSPDMVVEKVFKVAPPSKSTSGQIPFPGFFPGPDSFDRSNDVEEEPLIVVGYIEVFSTNNRTHSVIKVSGKTCYRVTPSEKCKRKYFNALNESLGFPIKFILVPDPKNTDCYILQEMLPANKAKKKAKILEK